MKSSILFSFYLSFKSLFSGVCSIVVNYVSEQKLYTRFLSVATLPLSVFRILPGAMKAVYDSVPLLSPGQHRQCVAFDRL